MTAKAQGPKDRPWIFRTYAGHSTAAKSNALYRANLAKDRDGDLVFMAKSPWDVGYQEEKNPELKFSATKER